MNQLALKKISDLISLNKDIRVVIDDKGCISYPALDVIYDVQNLFGLLLSTISLSAEEKMGILRNLHILTPQQLQQIEKVLEEEKHKLEQIDKKSPGYLEGVKKKNLLELKILSENKTN